MELDIQCKPLGSEAIHIGKTSDMSSSGVRFHIDEELPVGAMVELRIQWPSLQNSPLQFVLEGCVIRSGGSDTIVQMLRYAFGEKAMTTKRVARSGHPDALVA